MGNFEWTRGSKEGEYIFTGKKGNTVIDYAIRDEEVKERVERVKIGKRIESSFGGNLNKWREKEK